MFDLNELAPRRLPLRYYLPASMAGRWREVLPHVADGTIRNQLVKGQGPDAVPGETEDGTTGGAGLILGGPYRPDEDGWRPVKGGYWIHPGEAQPDDMVKPVVLKGTWIKGAQPGHRWLVPLLAIRANGIWQSALDPVLTSEGWQPPKAYVEITKRLTDAIDYASSVTEADIDRLVDLAIDVLAVHYAIARPVLEALEWFTMAMGPRILRVAAGGPEEVGDV